jgi:hypothetical protein
MGEVEIILVAVAAGAYVMAALVVLVVAGDRGARAHAPPA